VGGQESGEGVEPVGPVGVIKRLAAAHLGDVFRRVEIVGIQEDAAAELCKELAQSGLA
jgi:hypothetical protein